MLSIGGLSSLGLGQPDDFCTCRALPAPRQSVVERAVSLRVGPSLPRLSAAAG